MFNWWQRLFATLIEDLRRWWLFVSLLTLVVYISGGNGEVVVSISSLTVVVV
jgi:hypothetical protein